jgi:hypothetical protein
MSDIETVVKVVIAAGAALAAWWAADKLSMTISNKHLHEHVAEKFKAFADSIRDWCRQHAQTLKKGTKIFLRLASDAVGTGLKQTGKALVRTGGKLTAGKKLAALAEAPDGERQVIKMSEEVLTNDAIRELGFNPSMKKPQEQEYMTVG